MKNTNINTTNNNIYNKKNSFNEFNNFLNKNIISSNYFYI